MTKQEFEDKMEEFKKVFNQINVDSDVAFVFVVQGTDKKAGVTYNDVISNVAQNEAVAFATEILRVYKSIGGRQN